MGEFVKAEWIGTVRILGHLGYQIAQCTNPREMAESIPDFNRVSIIYEHLLHK
jgi:hypothetical protein